MTIVSLNNIKIAFQIVTKVICFTKQSFHLELAFLNRIFTLLNIGGAMQIAHNTRIYPMQVAHVSLLNMQLETMLDLLDFF